MRLLIGKKARTKVAPDGGTRPTRDALPVINFRGSGGRVMRGVRFLRIEQR